MTHPLEFLPAQTRKRLFVFLLVLTAALFGIFRLLDAPLHTDAAPNGIVSFELAGTARQAEAILASWRQVWLLLSSVPGGNPDIPNIPYIYAAFGLGLDYLFMPAYALTLSLAILLASGRHRGVLAKAGGWMGWAALAAAGFDAVENYALLRMLSGGPDGILAADRGSMCDGKVFTAAGRHHFCPGLLAAPQAGLTRGQPL